LRIVSADSGAAILNDRFDPIRVVATVAVLVEPPYRHPLHAIAEPALQPVQERTLIVREVELCRMMLEEVKADEVHVDITLGGRLLEEMTLYELMEMRISRTAKQELRRIMPDIRRIAEDIHRSHGVNVLAIGKESIPVRVAELTAGAYAFLYAAEQTARNGVGVKLGLPRSCTLSTYTGGVQLRSLLSTEHELAGTAPDAGGILTKISWKEGLNPKAQGFRLAIISPRSREER